MLIVWFLRLSTLKRLYVGVLLALAAFAFWTAFASFAFIKAVGVTLFVSGKRAVGTAIVAAYPPSRLATYWQWWAYFFDDEASGKPYKIALGIGAAIGALPLVGLTTRAMLDYTKSHSAPPLYGETHAATQREMIDGGLIIRRKL